MNLTVTERAQEYIAQEGNVITVRIVKKLIPSCTSAPQLADVPAAQLGKPADHEKTDFEVITIDNIKIYAHSSMSNYDDQISLRIDIETTLFDKRLAVYGMPLPAQSCGDCSACK